MDEDAALRVGRSRLIMPVHVERFVNAAWKRGVDRVTLDLEDSVPPARKEEARGLVRNAILMAARGGASVEVRINHDSWRPDITASLWPGLSGIAFPKAEDADAVHAAGMLIEALEAERGLPPNSVHLSLAIETVEGLNNVAALGAAHPRVSDIGGPAGGDFTVDLGIVLDPSLDQLDWARGELDLYVRSRGARGLGRWAPGQAITEYGDEEATRRAAEQHRRDGGRGAGGIHPSLVRPHNAGYTPTAEDLAEAAEVIAAVESAQASGAAYAVVRGRIATPRVAEAARDYLQYAAACRLADDRKAKLIASVARETGERA